MFIYGKGEVGKWGSGGNLPITLNPYCCVEPRTINGEQLDFDSIIKLVNDRLNLKTRKN